MYRWIKNNGKPYWEFDGDFEEFLIKIGVDRSHINNMKNQNVIKYNEDVCDKIQGTALKTMCVPTNKIIGTNRATEGLSFFENVRKMYDGEREPSRFKIWLEKAKNNLSDTLFLYQNLNCPVYMAYFSNIDKYYLVGDGNHRTLTALVLGAESILANIVYTCELNFDKFAMYEIENEFRKKMNITDIIKQKENSVAVIFYDKERNTKYKIKDFELNTDIPFSDMIGCLKNQIEHDIEIYNKISKLPKFMKKIVENFLVKRKSRIVQYFHIQKPDVMDYRQEIHLYSYYCKMNRQ